MKIFSLLCAREILEVLLLFSGILNCTVGHLLYCRISIPQILWHLSAVTEQTFKCSAATVPLTLIWTEPCEGEVFHPSYTGKLQLISATSILLLLHCQPSPNTSMLRWTSMTLKKQGMEWQLVWVSQWILLQTKAGYFWKPEYRKQRR